MGFVGAEQAVKFNYAGSDPCALRTKVLAFGREDYNSSQKPLAPSLRVFEKQSHAQFLVKPEVEIASSGKERPPRNDEIIFEASTSTLEDRVNRKVRHIILLALQRTS